MRDRFVSFEIIDLIGEIDLSDNPDHIMKLFSDFIEPLGFGSIALGYITNPATVSHDNLFHHGTWPDEWYERWFAKNYVVHDPVTRYALRSRKSFTWRTAYEFGSKFGQRLFNEGTEFGFQDGLVIPMHSNEGPAGAVSLGAQIVDISPREKAALELLSIHVYSRLEELNGPVALPPIAALSRREIDVLQYAAGGKTNWEIAQILHLSEHTVRDYIASAARKLNANNRAHTVAKAIQQAQIIP